MGMGATRPSGAQPARTALIVVDDRGICLLTGRERRDFLELVDASHGTRCPLLGASYRSATGRSASGSGTSLMPCASCPSTMGKNSC